MSIPSPHPNTALILDAIIGALQEKIQDEVDISLSASEFALGQPLESRNLDVCFGFDPIVGVDPVSEIVLSRGVLRIAGTLTDIAQSAFTPSATLGSVRLDKSYAFGSVLVQDGAIIAKLVTGTDMSPAPLVVRQDVDPDVMRGWLEQGLTPGAVSTASSHLELIRFVLVINSYNGIVSPTQKQIAVLMRDLRRIRGWGGFCEETMASYLTPAMIALAKNSKLDYQTLDLAVVSLVKAWTGLGWSPSFDVFWATNPEPLPERLRAYIEIKIGAITT